MKVTVVKTMPQNPFNEVEYRRSFNNVLRKASKRVVSDFKKGVKSWDHKPAFRIRVTSNGNQLSRLIYPASPNLNQYLYVHNGVSGRMIYPRKAKALRFKPYYVPASRRGSIWSRYRPKRGGKDVFSKGHWWPGIESRDFSFYIVLRETPRFLQDIKDAITKVKYGI